MAAFKNPKAAIRITAKPRLVCGWHAGRRFARHMVDGMEKPEANGVSLSPNCSTVLDEVLRPFNHMPGPRQNDDLRAGGMKCQVQVQRTGG